MCCTQKILKDYKPMLGFVKKVVKIENLFYKNNFIIFLPSLLAQKEWSTVLSLKSKIKTL